MRIIALFLLVSTSLSAQVDLQAIGQQFAQLKREHLYLHPRLGHIALQEKIIDKIRFDFVDRGYRNEKRSYQGDKAFAGEPITEIVLTLFPSNGGELVSLAVTRDNFSRYCEVEHIVALINFAHVVRAYVHSKTNCQDRLPQNIHEACKKLGWDNATLFSKSRTQKHWKKSLNKLLKNIIMALEQERMYAGVFYPKYMVEQVILAFFCLHFDNSDIPKLAALLKDDFFQPDDDYREQDLEVSGTVNLYEFEDPLPYGTAWAYDKKNQTIKEDTEINECMETILRHFFNLAFYDPIKYSFNLDKLKDHFVLVKSHMSPKTRFSFYLLLDFFLDYTPDRINEGSTKTRTAWNKIFADLNDSVANDELPIRYCSHYNNSLEAGFRNMILVLRKLLHLEDIAIPAKYQSREEKKLWIKNSLETVLSHISYGDIEVGAPQFFPYEQSITISAQISRASIKTEFQLNMESPSPGYGGHARFIKKPCFDNPPIMKQVVTDLSPDLFLDALHSNSTLHSLLFLNKQIGTRHLKIPIYLPSADLEKISSKFLENPHRVSLFQADDHRANGGIPNCFSKSR